MEWINKFTNPLAERTKSPLYGAFLFSWLIWNWRVVLTVLMPSKAYLNGLSLTTYISGNFINICDSLTIPLFYALSYIFILPKIDFLILKYTEKEKRRKIDEKIRIGRMHSVSGDLYFDLKLKFEDERKKIDGLDIYNKQLRGELLKKDNRIVELEMNNRELDVKINTSFEKLESAEMRITKFQNRKNLEKRFEGRWNLQYEDTQNPNFKGNEEIEIINDKYWIIRGPNDKELAFEIMLPDYDIEQKYFTFVKYNVRPGSTVKHCINTLNIVGSNRLEGFENKTISVIYTKKEI